MHGEECFNALANHVSMTGRRFEVGYAAAFEAFTEAFLCDSRWRSSGNKQQSPPGGMREATNPSLPRPATYRCKAKWFTIYVCGLLHFGCWSSGCDPYREVVATVSPISVGFMHGRCLDFSRRWDYPRGLRTV